MGSQEFSNDLAGKWWGNGGGGVEVPMRGYKSREECMRQNKKKKKMKKKER